MREKFLYLKRGICIPRCKKDVEHCVPVLDMFKYVVIIIILK